jgi:predicted O-methyltransferase YrrM
MNVFVLSTGRCGSTTFARACRKITNYSSAHESKSASRLPEPATPYQTLLYPDNHIEVDNRLSWMLGTLDKTYGDQAFYVHLLRDRDEVAHSFLKRWENRGTNIINAYAWGPLTLPLDQVRSLSSDQRFGVARHYWDTVNDNIAQFLADKPNQITMWLHDIVPPFEDFWLRIGAEGDLEGALAEWQTAYNASPAARPSTSSRQQSLHDPSQVAVVKVKDRAGRRSDASPAAGDAATATSASDAAVTQTRNALDAALANFSEIDLQGFISRDDRSSWSLDSDTLKFLVSLVGFLGPQHILEFGSGLSTRVLLRVTQALDSSCGVSSVDHDPDFIEQTLASVAPDLAERLRLQFAPLVTRQYGESYLPAYRMDTEKFSRSTPFDLCVIDGPPDGLGGREGTLYQVLPHCRAGTCILLDDAARPHEQRALRNWSAALGDAIEIRDLEGFGKGLAAIIVHRSVLPNRLWQHRLEAASRELEEGIPMGSRALVIDENQWPNEFAALVSFEIEREDSFPPAKFGDVVVTLRRKAAEGIDFVVFGWPAFWWFDHFRDLRPFLDQHARRVVSSERVVAYDLRGIAEKCGPSDEVASSTTSR